MRAKAALALALLLVASGCHDRPATSVPSERSPEVCERDKQALVELVRALPERALTADFARDLPQSTLGAPPRAGFVLEISERALVFDGKPVTPEGLGQALGAPGAARSLYLAAAPDTTIQRVRKAVALLPATTELSLLVRAEAGKSAAVVSQPSAGRSQELIEGVLRERDPEARRKLLAQGYAELSSCPALAEAIARAAPSGSNEHWPTLRQGALEALPSCSCAALDGPALGGLLAAEQRAGAGTLAALPFSFVRDERCGATMPLRSVQRLLQQIESFDADYAGKWQDDALRFEQVVTNDRLLVQFCDALPGETLAALERAHASVYLRTPSGDRCETWSFEPLSLGAPMGTFRRGPHGAPTPGAPAFHYWQAAEEISLFGPLVPGEPSKPTDERTWPCRTTHRFTGIDGVSVELEAGRWFFSEAACRAAPASMAPAGCATTQPSAP